MTVPNRSLQNPNLPSYQIAAHLAQRPAWEFLDDIYNGDRAWTKPGREGAKLATPKSRLYLPQESGEEDKDYQYRLDSSVYVDKFAQSVRDFVGLVFNNGIRLIEVPDAILEHWPSLGSGGVSGQRVMAQLAIASLRRGHTFCLVDYPTLDPSVRSHADYLASARQPFWDLVSPLDVLNWRTARVGSREVLVQATIQVQQIAPDGSYGEKVETLYKTLFPGGYRLTRITRNEHTGELVAQVVDEGVMGRRTRDGVVPLPGIPLVCLYGGDRTGFFRSNPTLQTLADLNRSHYSLKSDHRQKMHRCCFPQAVRVGGIDSDPLVLSPKLVIDVPLGGSFGWSGPNPASLTASRQELKDIEQDMDFLSADYLVKPGDRQAAATTQVQAGKIESELYLFAADFSAGINDCLDAHANYLGLPSGGRAELNTKFFQQATDNPQLLQAFIQMRGEGDLTRSEIRRLARDRFMPDTFHLDDEDSDDFDTTVK